MIIVVNYVFLLIDYYLCIDNVEHDIICNIILLCNNLYFIVDYNITYRNDKYIMLHI